MTITDIRYLMSADRLGVLHFVIDPASSETFIGHNIESESVFMASYDPTEESIDDYPRSVCDDRARSDWCSRAGD